ncbi:tol-pal system protein YbgF [Desulfohalovibrio reitneri]|uniref:tol-pal system protein YbgF n=1 Tax=Desulfohalovibrio reitneri TaxID=1307759 RepID=UPI0005529C7C|nr:tol-pal system protein YbgF [Desulfohalovibrio reitneri]
MQVVTRFLCLALLLALSAGCASKGNGDAVTEPSGPEQPESSEEWRMQNLEESFLQFKENQRGRERAIEAMREEMDTRLREMEERLARMEDRLRGVEAVQAAMGGRVTPGSVEQRKEERAASEQSLKTQTSGKKAKTSAVAEDKEAETGQTAPAANAKAMYDEAVKLVVAEKYDPGREMLNEFLGRHKESPLKPNALYWLGETYYGQKRYAQAILTFKEVISQYPEHHKSADALLKIGYAYDKLEDEDNAQFYLRALVDEYPEADSAPLARQKLRKISE